MLIPVDRSTLVSLIKTCHAAYGLGDKPALGLAPAKVKTSDCSGFVRWTLWKITHGKFKLKALGSVLQRAEIQAAGFERCKYTDCQKLDSILRVFYLPPEPGGYGHTGLCINGYTVECYGGHGVGRRIWNTPVLLNNAVYCYVLTGELP